MSATNLLVLPSTVNTAGGSEALAVGQLTQLAVDVNVTAASGTSPTLTLFLERQGADGVWYAVWSPTAVTAAGVVSTSVGAGLATAALPVPVMRFRWALGGTTPSFTFSASIIGR